MRDAIRSTASSRKTIDKAMSLLTVFSHQQPELSVTDLAEILKMDKSIISRLASSLRTWGMLEKNPTTGRLRIGSTAMKIGALFSQRNTMVELSMPVLKVDNFHSSCVCQSFVVLKTQSVLNISQ